MFFICSGSLIPFRRIRSFASILSFPDPFKITVKKIIGLNKRWNFFCYKCRWTSDTKSCTLFERKKKQFLNIHHPPMHLQAYITWKIDRFHFCPILCFGPNELYMLNGLCSGRIRTLGLNLSSSIFDLSHKI